MRLAGHRAPLDDRLVGGAHLHPRPGAWICSSLILISIFPFQPRLGIILRLSQSVS
jgi:hypothetical protein